MSRLLSVLRKMEARSPRLYRRDLWLITLAGLLFKLFFLWYFVGPLRQYELNPKFGVWWGDSASYYGPALSLYKEGSFHSYARTPGYPAFLALIYAFTRDTNPVSNLNLTTIYVVQSVLISLGCLPIAGAIHRLTGFRSLALIGAFLWAFHNSARYYSHWVLTDGLAAALTCLLVYTLVRALKDGGPVPVEGAVQDFPENRTSEMNERRRKVPLVWFAVSGLIMFALTLIRPSCSLLAVPVGLGMLITHFGFFRRRRQLIAIALLLLALPLSSQKLWALRNQVVEGQSYFCRLSAFGVYAYGFAFPIQMSKGVDFYVAHRRIWGEWNAALEWSPEGMDEQYKIRAKYFLKKHPDVILSHFAGSVPMLFVPTLPVPPVGITPHPSKWPTLKWETRGIHALTLLNGLFEFALTCVLLSLLLVGLFSRRRWPDPAQRGFFITAWLTFLYWVLIHSVSARYTGFFGAARFFLPYVPILFVAGAVVLARMPAFRSILPVKEAEDGAEPVLVEPQLVG